MKKALKVQKKFNAAIFTPKAVASAIEVGYNFYKITPEKASNKAGYKFCPRLQCFLQLVVELRHFLSV